MYNRPDYANPFGRQRPFTSLSVMERASLLEEWGDIRQAETLRLSTTRAGITDSFAAGPYDYTTYAYGFVPLGSEGDSVTISDAHSIKADKSLIGKRISIRLDGFRVFSYPGLSKTHTVLVNFYAQNRVGGQVDHLNFNHVYKVREPGYAGVVGYPVFSGINVGAEGILFTCSTVKVASKPENELVSLFASDVFQKGVQLAATVISPVVSMVSAFCVGTVKYVLDRSRRNRTIQTFDLGLGFSEAPASLKLQKGNYVIAQVPDDFNWGSWKLSNGRITSGRASLPFNSFIVRVEQYDG